MLLSGHYLETQCNKIIVCLRNSSTGSSRLVVVASASYSRSMASLSALDNDSAKNHSSDEGWYHGIKSRTVEVHLH